VTDVFPEILFMPTGGVTSENMESWFDAGASSIGMGNAMISTSSMDNKEFNSIRERAIMLINQVAAKRHL
jgi:2-dehydro-3-deoxyphosphogluconate aldolase/(4S)-4-hydroxy-2-oxoglutarate aldolase